MPFWLLMSVYYTVPKLWYAKTVKVRLVLAAQTTNTVSKQYGVQTPKRNISRILPSVHILPVYVYSCVRVCATCDAARSVRITAEAPGVASVSSCNSSALPGPQSCTPRPPPPGKKSNTCNCWHPAAVLLFSKHVYPVCHGIAKGSQEIK